MENNLERASELASLSSIPQGASAPSLLTIRKLEIDIQDGFGRHWNGGDAFMTQFNNALSMSFPVGEQFFIDSVRDCATLLPENAENAELHWNISQFIGQEATHRHIHALYNAHLSKQGLVNRWEGRAKMRLARARERGLRPIDFLAITAAFEHMTAMLSDYVLRYDRRLDWAEPTMRTLWRWHAAEETEHRAVAFNLFSRLGGNHRRRVRWYIFAMTSFVVDAIRQTILNLWHDRSLFKISTWLSAASFIAGRNGIVRRCRKAAFAYLRKDFHPDVETGNQTQESTMSLAQRWLIENANFYREIRS